MKYTNNKVRFCRAACLIALTETGCSSGGGADHHHHHHQESEPVAQMLPPSPQQARGEFLDRAAPMFAAAIRQRLNTSQLKQRLILAVTMDGEGADPMGLAFVDKLNADPSFGNEFFVIVSHSAASDGVPSDIAAKHKTYQSPDGTEVHTPIYDPRDIYVLDLRYGETPAPGGGTTMTMRCRLTHPQTRELILQISPSFHEVLDGQTWRLEQ